MSLTKKLIVALLLLPVSLLAFGEEGLTLDHAPDLSHNQAALQKGAKLFVNYCLSCHGASGLRYNKLEDLGLTAKQIKDNLMFTADKIGEPMTIAMRRPDAKKWLGAWPPDLTLIARAKASESGSGADWLYTYLRSFYRDDTRPTGWNNVVFKNVGMPNVLWQLQGEQVMDGGHLKLVKAGTLTPQQYNEDVADLVSFLVYMGEPAAQLRKEVGIGVLLLLAVLLVFAYLLKREYWKDIH